MTAPHTSHHINATSPTTSASAPTKITSAYSGADGDILQSLMGRV